MILFRFSCVHEILTANPDVSCLYIELEWLISDELQKRVSSFYQFDILYHDTVHCAGILVSLSNLESIILTSVLRLQAKTLKLSLLPIKFV